MNQAEVYWSAYKNLEDELIDITKYIYCDEKQKNVYSIAIADLIVKCSIEIEAVSKFLYKKQGGKDIYKKNGQKKNLLFDSDCLSFLNCTLGLSQKKIIVSNCYIFWEDKSKVIKPLYEAHIKGSGLGCDWKDAYQALKHDLYENIHKYGTIKNLVLAMGALYILNLYLLNKRYELLDANLFDERLESKLFSVLVYRADNLKISGDEIGDGFIIKPQTNIEECIYIIKVTDKNFIKIIKSFFNENEKILQKVKSSANIKKFLEKRPNYKITSVVSLIIDAEGIAALKKYIQFPEFSKYLIEKEREAVLNNGSKIYPQEKFQL